MDQTEKSSCRLAADYQARLAKDGYETTQMGFFNRSEALRWIRMERKSGWTPMKLFSRQGTDDRSRMVFAKKLPDLPKAIVSLEEQIIACAVRRDFNGVSEAVEQWKHYSKIAANPKRKW